MCVLAGQVQQSIGRLVVRGDRLGDFQQLQRAALRGAHLRAGTGELQSLVPEHAEQQPAAAASCSAPAESLSARALSYDEQVLEQASRGQTQLRRDLPLPQEAHL